ncbi:MAG: LuxR C-terminal-related transcriptional regulator [Sulfurimonas sp.]|nr:LuxR C-terminal-related transcriptional regulator [Sulfurimonas sp.]MDQ7059904.1 LuxR C-terminal-related transcriptional regulator [Sulfurimonas sp.]
MKLIIHSDDIQLSEYWESIFKHDFILIDNIIDLLDVQNSLILLNFTSLTSGYEDIIEKLNTGKNKLLVLDRTANIDKAKNLLRLGIKGYGNAMMKEHFILSAVETISEGMIWLYPAFTTMLIEEISSSNKVKDIDWSQLSAREKGVALLLKDGLTYKVIADRLNIKPRTIKAHAKSIYTKLNVKDRLGLALLIK